MSDRPPRLLFVIMHLAQGGSERFTYEVCKALHGRGFRVAVLTKSFQPGYYYPRIRDLGIPVHRRLPVWLGRLQRHARPLFVTGRPVFEWLHRWHARLLMRGLLDRFDVINAVQIENYYLLQPLLPSNDRVVTYLMSNAFQYTFDPYEDCLPGRDYRFILTDPTQRDDYSNAPCAGASTLQVPLALDLRDASDCSRYMRLDKPYDIGVFIRLCKDRPIVGLLEAFARLTAQTEARLRLWGRGDPALIAADVRRLNIADRVLFEGHTPNIEQTIKDAGLSVLWMTAHGPTIGYASIELGALGLPMLFWNVSPAIADADVARQTSGALRTFQRPDALAAETLRLFDDPAELHAVGNSLRAYICSTYDLDQHVGRLADYILSRVPFPRVVPTRAPSPLGTDA